MRRVLVTILGPACMGLLACGGSPSRPSTLATPAFTGLPAGSTLTALSGETGAPVPGAQFVVAGRSYVTGSGGQAAVTEAADLGSLVDVRASGFLDRQTLLRSRDATRFMLWPRTSATGLDETYTVEIVYTLGSSTPPPSGSTPLRRLRAGATRAYVLESEEIRADDHANVAHERAVETINEALRGRVVYALAHTRPPEGVVFESRIDPNEPDCQAGRIRANVLVSLAGGEITGGRMLFCNMEAARSPTVAHEMGHTFGLHHSPDPRDLMSIPFSTRRGSRFGERETLVMHLLLERRGGNRFPDNDRDASASVQRTLVIGCP